MVQKTQKIGMIVYNLARELLVKDKGGIATLPQNKEILTKVQDIFDMLKAGGYNPISAERDIKNTKDLKRVLTDVEMKLTMEKDLRKKSSEGIEQVLDKMDKGVPLNPSDQAKIEGGTPDKVLDAFKGFTPRVIQGGKLEGIEKLLKSGDVKKGVAPKTTKETIERKSMIDPKLTQEENIKNIMAENKAAAKRLEQKMNKEKDLGDKLKDLPDDIDPDAMAEGGLMRIGMFAGGAPFRRLLQFLNQQTGRTGSEGLNKLKMNDQIKFFAEKQGFNPDQNRIEYIEQVLEALKADRKLVRSLESDAPSAVTGKAKDEMELIADKMFTENFLGDTQKGRFKGMTSKDYDKSILEVETILKNLKPEGRKPNAEGGLMRSVFEKGGMSRRNFLKLMGGLASLPFVGKLFKGAKVASKAAPVVETTSGVPAYFPKLVEKIKLLGDDVTRTNATSERQVVTKYKDYEMTENLSTGNIEIEKTNEAMGTFVDMSGEVQTYDGIASKEIMQYSPPETIIGKNNKPVKVPAQYEETTARSTGIDGKLEDYDDGLESIDEILEEVGETKIKKASGGLAYMMGE